jgi:type II secretory pathway pseudopilin PulG
VEKMSEIKYISKKIFVLVLIVFIVVSIILVGILVTYLPRVSDLETQLSEKDQQIANLNTTISGLNSQIIDLQTDLSQANNEITSLQGLHGNYQTLIDSYISIITLQSSGYLLNGATFSQNANQTSQAVLQLLEYAGYVTIVIESNSTTTYTQVIYNSLGVSFNQKITVGESGSAAFPILPGDVEINIGNEESENIVSGIVTVNYIY